MRLGSKLNPLTNYLSRIVAPVQIHQGLVDDAVPVTWSDALAKELQEVQYFPYPGANHDMVPVWNTVVLRDIEFFRKYLK